MTCWTEDLPKSPGIYKLTNKINGKIYIGQSKNIKGRMKGHRDKKLTVISDAIQKYGWTNFKKEAIEIYPQNTPEEVLLYRETFWIKFLKSHVKHGGYNVREDTIDPRREKFRQKRQENKNKNKKPGSKKRTEPRSESLALESAVNRKPVKQIDMATGEVLRVWPSINMASQNLSGSKVGASAIIRAIKKDYGCKSFRGFYWEYDKSNTAKTPMPEITRKKISESHKGISSGEKNPMFGRKHSDETRKKMALKRPAKRVAQIDKSTGEIIKIWDSAKEAAKALSKTGNKSPIIACINQFRSGCKTAFGYKWEYVEKELS